MLLIFIHRKLKVHPVFSPHLFLFWNPFQRYRETFYPHLGPLQPGSPSPPRVLCHSHPPETLWVRERWVLPLFLRVMLHCCCPQKLRTLKHPSQLRILPSESSPHPVSEGSREEVKRKALIRNWQLKNLFYDVTWWCNLWLIYIIITIYDVTVIMTGDSEYL